MTGVGRQPTADAVGLHERASATPTRADAQRPSLQGSAPAWTNQELTLRTQQEWFAAIVSTPEAQAPPVNEQSATRLVTPSKSLSSLERIEIYRPRLSRAADRVLGGRLPRAPARSRGRRIREFVSLVHCAFPLQRAEPELFWTPHGRAVSQRALAESGICS